MPVAWPAGSLNSKLNVLLRGGVTITLEDWTSVAKYMLITNFEKEVTVLSYIYYF